jgi:hypothetical protein
MDPNYEDLALLRAHEPGLRPPTRHLPPMKDRRARRRVASVLRRVAHRLDH